MALFVTFLCLFYSVFQGEEFNVPALRKLFYEARDQEEKADLLFDTIGHYSGGKGILIAYKGGAYALKAKYGANPISKLKNIKAASKYFTEAVKNDPQNLEIRFIRYAVEVQTPSLLGYSEHVEEDKGHLLEGLRKYPASGFTPETARIARDFMRDQCACTDNEKKFVQELKF